MRDDIAGTQSGLSGRRVGVDVRHEDPLADSEVRPQLLGKRHQPDAESGRLEEGAPRPPSLQILAEPPRNES